MNCKICNCTEANSCRNGCEWFEGSDICTSCVKKALSFSLEAAQKFVDKVESGRARSSETYADMKDIIKLVSHIL